MSDALRPLSRISNLALVALSLLVSGCGAGNPVRSYTFRDSHGTRLYEWSSVPIPGSSVGRFNRDPVRRGYE